MFVLKVIGKIVLLPIWLIIGALCMTVHIIVSIFGVFHGFWKLFFSLFIILAVAFGMWQNVFVFACAIAAGFLLLMAGAFIETFLEFAKESIGKLIIA